MHIHGHSMNIPTAGLYSAAQSERMAARRAAETRRKLLKKASGIEAGASPDEMLLIGHWLDPQSDEGPGSDGYGAASSGRDSDFD